MHNGDGNARHCRYCHEAINTRGAANAGTNVWAAWLAGYCSPLHQTDDAKKIVLNTAAWWQRVPVDASGR